jgi:hypothetical protein
LSLDGVLGEGSAPLWKGPAGDRRESGPQKFPAFARCRRRPGYRPDAAPVIRHLRANAGMGNRGQRPSVDVLRRDAAIVAGRNLKTRPLELPYEHSAAGPEPAAPPPDESPTAGPSQNPLSLLPTEIPFAHVPFWCSEGPVIALTWILRNYQNETQPFRTDPTAVFHGHETRWLSQHREFPGARKNGLKFGRLDFRKREPPGSLGGWP